MRQKGLNIKRLLIHVPDDGVLIIFNGNENSWRTASNRNGFQVWNCEWIPTRIKGLCQRTKRRDMFVRKKATFYLNAKAA